MNNINYAYKSGVLEGTLISMTFRYKIPGVEVTDHEAFKKFIESEIDRAHELTLAFSKEHSN